jgi:hypothetical protein
MLKEFNISPFSKRFLMLINPLLLAKEFGEHVCDCHLQRIRLFQYSLLFNPH